MLKLRNDFARAGTVALGAIALALVLGMLSHHAGRRLARTGYFSASERAVVVPVERGDPAGKQRLPRLPLAGAAKTPFEKLKRIAGQSLNLMTDSGARAAIELLLAELSAGELEEIYAQLQLTGDFGKDDLLTIVGAKWAALDPDAALRTAFSKSSTRGVYLVNRLFREWANDHPLEALAWLDSGRVSPELEGFKKSFREMAVIELIRRDSTAAKVELAKMERSSADRVLEMWGYSYAGDASMREALIAYARASGDPADFSALNAAVIRGWPEEDGEGLREHLQKVRQYLEADSIPAEVRPLLDAQVVQAEMDRNGQDAQTQALAWWMGRHSGSAFVPEGMREAISSWIRNGRESAMQWLDTQPPSPQRDALNAAAAPMLMAEKNFSEAARRLRNVADAELRNNGSRRLELLWSNADPAAAKAWKDSEAVSPRTSN